MRPQEGGTSTVMDCVNANAWAFEMEVADALAFLLPTEQVCATPSFGTSHRIIDFTVDPAVGSDELRFPTMLSPYSKKWKSAEQGFFQPSGSACGDSRHHICLHICW